MKLTQLASQTDIINVLEALANVCRQDNFATVASVKSFRECDDRPDGVTLQSANDKTTVSIYLDPDTEKWMWEAYGEDMEELVNDNEISQADLYCDNMVALMEKLVSMFLTDKEYKP